MLAAVDVTAWEAALTRWVIGGRSATVSAAARVGQTWAKQRTVLAVDGKTLRRSGAADEQARPLSVYDHTSGLVLTQAAVADGDEVAAFTVALNCPPDLAGYLVTGDALHCQRRHADFLAARGGHLLFMQGQPRPP